MQNHSLRAAAEKSGRYHYKRKYKHQLAGYLFALPGYSIYFLFVFIPVVVTFYLSFTNYDLYHTRDFIGISNYIGLAKDPTFLISVKNTFIYSLFTIIPQMLLGLITAVMLNENLYGQKFFRVSFYIPNITAMAAISMVWLWIYDPTQGILNSVLRTLGLPAQKWLFDLNLAMPSVIIMSIWKAIGYNMIIYLSGLQQIPGELYEAAEVDGATGIRRFWHITVPMLKPTSFFLLITGSVNSFSVFEQVNILTQGGPMNATTTIVHQIYSRAFTEFKMGYASAIAVFLLAVVLIITFVNFKYGNEGADIEAG